ncbi:hypothetical protein ACFCX4_34055 [Kitasatospora sp. NPDC056327]|uniref:hypothetical protein n=1 Tax=Kitasatospora sp. NPDC056327 TaxID=3345785 RepID=UPI0035E1ED8B
MGSNSYNEDGTDRPWFKVTRAGGSGNQTTVTWTVTEKPAATVSMGDSFISGEGGRWNGNGNTGPEGAAFGTDRAAFGCNGDETQCNHDSSRVYGTTNPDSGNKCDRSDVAEIRGAVIEGIGVERRFNLACSGAVTDNVIRSAFKGEPAQVQQLRNLTENYRIKLVALSIGGNDLQFSDIVTSCATKFMIPNPFSPRCEGAWRSTFEAALGPVENKVVETIGAIRGAMTDAGYDSTPYRLVAQSYPSPLARSTEYRYPTESYDRQNLGGCPFFNSDADWAANEVIPRIGAMVQRAAQRGGASYLDLTGAFAGHELCSVNAGQATAHDRLNLPIPREHAEWVRWVATVSPFATPQGTTQEYVHPNAYGQQALSKCLESAYASGGDSRCLGSAGNGNPNPVPPLPGTVMAKASADSMNRATGFLRSRMDTFATSGPRVPQSYTGGFFGPGAQFGATGFQSSFTYDNAVTIAALLAKGTGSDVSHAKDLGDTLLYAQDHDPVNDGRIRTSYMPDPFITTLGRDYPVGTPYISGWSVYTGNMAWAGMAFAHLYKATGDSRYLNGALRAGNWIQTNSADSRGIGGYTGGLAGGAEDGSGLSPRTWKATEHNIDVGAFFAMLNQLTGDQAWKSRSDNAFAFVKSMLSADQNHLWAGTGLDGVTVNEDAVPEDIQTWSYQATLDPAYSRTTDWVAGRMAATDNGFTGVSFSVVDTTGVWFEGTAHLLAVYQTRRAPGDTEKAAALISTLQRAQASAPNTNGTGIVAASHDGLNTGQGDLYYASVHTGATAWYVLGALGGNPFRL